MRIAILSDVHGNRLALEAVIKDLRETSPDLVMHGGDLAHGGSSPSGVVDLIRSAGWQGVVGNVDELLFRPESLDEYAKLNPQIASQLDPIRAMADFAVEELGAERLAWLSELPTRIDVEGLSLVHASQRSLWKSPSSGDPDDLLASAFDELPGPALVFGHTHVPFVRKCGASGRTIANSGSVGLPFDGDTRACYLLIDGAEIEIRRVPYDLDSEVWNLSHSQLPFSRWTARCLLLAAPVPMSADLA